MKKQTVDESKVERVDLNKVNIRKMIATRTVEDFTVSLWLRVYGERQSIKTEFITVMKHDRLGSAELHGSSVEKYEMKYRSRNEIMDWFD
jgi:hypothetical protein